MNLMNLSVHKLRSILRLVLFIIATVLAYVAIFFPYGSGASFDDCIMKANDSNKVCTVAESFDIVSLLVALFVMSIIVVYLVLRVYYGSTANGEFEKYSKMVYFAMLAIFIAKLVASVLITFVVIANSTSGTSGGPDKGYFILVTSTILYFVTLFV